MTDFSSSTNAPWSDPDPIASARGVLVGVALSVGIWGVVLAVWWWAS